MQSKQRGWTVTNFIVVVIVVGMIGLALWFFSRSNVQAVTAAEFVNPPTTIPQAPATGTFVYEITRKIGSSPARGIPSRTTKFKVFPEAGVEIVSLNTTPVGADVGTKATDASGQVTVVVQIDYAGTARLVAIDKDTNREEQVRFMGR